MVDADAEKPGAERGLAAKTCERTVGLNEGYVRGFLRFKRIAEVRQAKLVESGLMRPYQFRI